MEELNLDELNRLLLQLQEELNQYQVNLSLTDLLNGLLQGNLQFSLTDFLRNVYLMFNQELLLSMALLGKIIVLAVAFSLLQQMGTAFGKHTIQQVCHLVMTGVAALMIMESAKSILLLGEHTVTLLSNFMLVLLPVELVLLVAMGNVTTAAILQPSLLMAVQAITALFRHVLVPLLFFEFTVKIVNRLSNQFQLTSLAKLLRKIILWSIGFVTTCFMAVLSIQGISGVAMDSVALRAAKYTAGAAVPVVGSTISSMMELIISGSLLVKNGLGILGLLVVLLLTVFPLVKIFVLYLLYMLGAAMLQPLQANDFAGMLEDTAGSFILVFAVVTITALMFFMMLLIVLTAANGSAALR